MKITHIDDYIVHDFLKDRKTEFYWCTFSTDQIKKVSKKLKIPLLQFRDYENGTYKIRLNKRQFDKYMDFCGTFVDVESIELHTSQIVMEKQPMAVSPIQLENENHEPEKQPCIDVDESLDDEFEAKNIAEAIMTEDNEKEIVSVYDDLFDKSDQVNKNDEDYIESLKEKTTNRFSEVEE